MGGRYDTAFLYFERDESGVGEGGVRYLLADESGESPAKWLENYQGRTPLVHLKDMTTDGEQFFAELGTGGVDIERVLELGGKNGVEWWIVEQDQSKQSPLDSIAESFSTCRNKT